jgi:hypothetical protein
MQALFDKNPKKFMKEKMSAFGAEKTRFSGGGVLRKYSI